MAHPLEQFATAKALREYEFVHHGVHLKVSGRPFGDDYFAVLYPDPEKARAECAHFSVVNGRATAYPTSIYGDVQSILRTSQGTDADAPLDPSTVFALYDHDPGLFSKMRAYALQALGIMEDLASNSGAGAWQAAHSEARELERALKRGDDAVAKEIAPRLRRLTALAVRDFNPGADVADEDDPRDVDPAMEALAGN